MDRALREFRIRGVTTNLPFLEKRDQPSATSARATYTTRFIDETPELFQLRAPPRPRHAPAALHGRRHRQRQSGDEGPRGARPAAMSSRGGRRRCRTSRRRRARATGCASSARRRSRAGCASSSGCWSPTRPCATRTSRCSPRACAPHDMLAIAPRYARHAAGNCSRSSAGAARPSTSRLRFLKEDPWERLQQLRAAMPNMLLQMLLRASNAVGYTNYPDNVVRHFVQQAAANGIDLFRVFDSLNWVENMRVAIDAVLETGALCEAAICYTGDLFDPERAEVRPRLLREAGEGARARRRHILGIKDMAGALQAARGARAGQGAARGDRPADPLPHPRHQRHRRGERARRGRRRRGCGRRARSTR